MGQPPTLHLKKYMVRHEFTWHDMSDVNLRVCVCVTLPGHLPGQRLLGHTQAGWVQTKC